MIWQNGLDEAVARMREHLATRDEPIKFDTRDRMALAFLLDAVCRFENKCKACRKALVICPHCEGEDDIEGGEAQNGFYLCEDKACSGYEVCCGC